MNKNDWNEYKLLVLNKLDTVTAQNETLIRDTNMIKVELATLKAKAALWGSIAGSGASLLVAFIIKKVI